MRVTLVDPLSDGRWDDFIASHPDSTIFHHSSWARVLKARYEDGLAYRAAVDDHGNIQAVAPFVRINSRLTGRRLASLPSSEYCFPLARSDDALERLLGTAKRDVEAGRVSYVEIRGWKGPTSPETLGFVRSPCFLRHVAELHSDPDVLRATLVRGAKQLRRNLKRAEKSGLVVREAADERDLRAFHDLTVVTRRRLRLLPWPYDLLRSIFRHVIMPGHGFLLLAEKDGRALAGSMYFCHRDTVTLKFNASDRGFAQYRGNYLVTWKAMERACLNGHRYLDLGLCDPDNQGLATFKGYWGTEETVFPHYYYPAPRGVSSMGLQGRLLYRAHTIANRWMPQPALRLSARLLHRHLG